MIQINGRTYSGNNISINNGKITIDGKDCTPDDKEINIHVEGNLQSINADSCTVIKVGGDVKSVQTMSGNVEVSGVVEGDVKTMSGDVKCGPIAGNVSTMSGDIKHNKL